MSHPASRRLPAIDAIKVVASQLIVLHHLALYGPMANTVHTAAPGLVDALRNYALMAVPAFLVVGGFLAARGLLPRLAELRLDALPPMLMKRYLRLTQPYFVALIAAIVCAWLARTLAPYPDVPGAPTPSQVMSHLLLLQDIVGADALSTGVWYVAIDFQLYALLLLLVAMTWPLRRLVNTEHARIVLAVCAVLTVLSLFWLNRNRELEMWAPYFFGAYGLGILAEQMSRRSVLSGTALLFAITGAALFVEWRGRILVAGVTALLLVWSRGGRLASPWASSGAIDFLSRISYSLFLIHYPVSLLVGAIVTRWWPDSVALNAIGLLVTWATSIAAAAVLHRYTEAHGGERLARPALIAR
ncbi:MAG: acyltransferase [Gammaproteobacteria bacterium]|nr:acyltransferase [Gammaproteobacteria bacterium]MBU1414634.1 acyltransferase [Gammaproteobacteria bacterium]